MNAIIEKNRTAINDLCVRYRVCRLEVFGSAARGPFNMAQSDLDFLVEFSPMSPAQHADAFFGFLEELEQFLGLPVDLIERAPIRNPYFLKSIDQTKVVLYATA